MIVALFFLARHYFLKKEIKRAKQQLKEVNSHSTEKKIHLAFFDKDIENLAQEINHQIDLTKLAIAEKRRTENELKQAISNISHDIRTPMTTISGYIQLLESEDLPTEKRAEYLATVKGGAKRLKVLLEDFFELSIIESEDYPLKMETIKLNYLVSEVLVGFYEEFHQYQIEPSIHIPEVDILLHSDISAVKRVIENLVLNAIKHSTGNVAIKLEKGPSTIQLTISNEVDQLNEKDLSLLFDRFYKLDQTRSKKSTGLGLSIAKSLMAKMGGNLTAELIENQLYMKCEWTYR
jgi:signal transduction histidine kinase